MTYRTSFCVNVRLRHIIAVHVSLISNYFIEWWFWIQSFITPLWIDNPYSTVLTVVHSMVSLGRLMIVSHSTIMSGDCRMLLWLFPVTIRSNSVSGRLIANFKWSITSLLEKRNMNWTDSMTERAWTMGNTIRNRVDYWLKLKVRDCHLANQEYKLFQHQHALQEAASGRLSQNMLSIRSMTLLCRHKHEKSNFMIVSPIKSYSNWVIPSFRWCLATKRIRVAFQ